MTDKKKLDGPGKGNHGARSTRRGKYATARIAAGMTFDILEAIGFGTHTIVRADAGRLPKKPARRAAYLAAINFTAVKS